MKVRSGMVACAAGVVVSSLAAAILVGWAFDIQALTALLPQLPPMRPNTAAGFVLAGASLCMLTVAHVSQTLRWMMRVTVALTLFMGVATLSEHIFGWNLGIDQLFPTPTATFDVLNPGRIPPLAAAHFTFVGLALVLIDRRSYALAQVLAMGMMAVALIVLGGYLFGLRSFTAPGLPPPTAAHAALFFLILSLGILASSAASGLVGRVQAQLPAIGLGSALFLLTLAIAASFVDTQRMVETTSQVDETHSILARLGDVSLGIERVVTFSRVFLLTGNEDLIAPLAPVQRQVTNDLTGLRRMFAGDSDLLAKLASLEDLIERRLARSNEIIDVRRRVGEVQQATEEIPSGGEYLSAEIRTLIEDMEQAVQFRLDQRRATATASHATTLVAATFTGLVSAIVLLLAFVAFRRQA
ncbi:MAG: hypothetical protein GTO41_28530, partial [Burkholderiales bacterium]|nr:hypothetical protein [Burkholderiales bacterium]